MYPHPTILEQQPFLVTSRLTYWELFADEALPGLSLKCYIENCLSRKNNPFLLVVKEEPSYKKCSRVLTKCMLYKLPIGFFEKEEHEDTIQQILKDLSKSKNHTFLYNFYSRK